MKAARRIETRGFLQWVRPAHQERSRRALTSLLDAAEQLVAARGFDETSIQDIVAVSGTSVGSFYRRFKDKHGLLQALHERFCEEARATADTALDPARWVGTPANEMIAAIARFLVDVFRERRGLFRAFLVSGASDPVVRTREVELTSYLSACLARCLRIHRRDVNHPDAALAARTTLLLLVGILSHATLLGAGEFDIDDPTSVAELVRAACRYLGTEPPAGA
jgi:AcrR family transcriptional regulator